MTLGALYAALQLARQRLATAEATVPEQTPAAIAEHAVILAVAKLRLRNCQARYDNAIDDEAQSRFKQSR